MTTQTIDISGFSNGALPNPPLARNGATVSTSICTVTSGAIQMVGASGSRLPILSTTALGSGYQFASVKMSAFARGVEWGMTPVVKSTGGGTANGYTACYIASNNLYLQDCVGNALDPTANVGFSNTLSSFPTNGTLCIDADTTTTPGSLIVRMGVNCTPGAGGSENIGGQTGWITKKVFASGFKTGTFCGFTGGDRFSGFDTTQRVSQVLLEDDVSTVTLTNAPTSLSLTATGTTGGITGVTRSTAAGSALTVAATSSNTAVATVSGSMAIASGATTSTGGPFVVTPLTAGSATITATDSSGATGTTTVTVAAAPTTYYLRGISLVAINGGTLPSAPTTCGFLVLDKLPSDSTFTASNCKGRITLTVQADGTTNDAALPSSFATPGAFVCLVGWEGNGTQANSAIDLMWAVGTTSL